VAVMLMPRMFMSGGASVRRGRPRKRAASSTRGWGNQGGGAGARRAANRLAGARRAATGAGRGRRREECGEGEGGVGRPGRGRRCGSRSRRRRGLHRAFGAGVRLRPRRPAVAPASAIAGADGQPGVLEGQAGLLGRGALLGPEADGRVRGGLRKSGRRGQVDVGAQVGHGTGRPRQAKPDLAGRVRNQPGAAGARRGSAAVSLAP
jgi:hypothetical protein